MRTRSWIDQQRCEGCGLCVAACPAHIPQRTTGQGKGNSIELRADVLQACIQCGHFIAVCPNMGIHIAGLSYERDLFDLAPTEVTAEAFLGFAASRRSTRVFKDKAMPRELLQKMVEIITAAPMGYPPHKVEVTVVQRRDTIERALPVMVELYEDLGQWMANPFIRFMIKRRIPAEAFNSLCNHVLPHMDYRLAETRAGKTDTITRGAPAMLLFHAHRDADGPSDDALIALTYGLLATHALGLGATAIGLVPPAVERSAELRDLFQIPASRKILICLIVGYPRIRFKKGIRRDLPAVHGCEQNPLMLAERHEYYVSC